MEHTDKQIEIMDLLFKRAGEGAFIEFWELKEQLSYGPSVTPQAIQFSIRYLEKHGMLERTYRDRKLYLKPTLAAYQVLRPDADTLILKL